MAGRRSGGKEVRPEGLPIPERVVSGILARIRYRVVRKDWRMSKAQPTAIQNIALSLIFAVMGEYRYNRTYDEYMAISDRLPPLKQLTFQVNRLLQQLHKCNNECKGFVLPQLCRFKAGDQRIVYESYPGRISYETIRAALVAAGMREQRWRKA